jgi:hypothetical protein
VAHLIPLIETERLSGYKNVDVKETHVQTGQRRMDLTKFLLHQPIIKPPRMSHIAYIHVESCVRIRKWSIIKKKLGRAFDQLMNSNVALVYTLLLRYSLAKEATTTLVIASTGSSRNTGNSGITVTLPSVAV